MDDVGALYHVMARGFNVGRYPNKKISSCWEPKNLTAFPAADRILFVI